MEGLKIDIMQGRSGEKVWRKGLKKRQVQLPRNRSLSEHPVSMKYDQHLRSTVKHAGQC